MASIDECILFDPRVIANIVIKYLLHTQQQNIDYNTLSMYIWFFHVHANNKYIREQSIFVIKLHADVFFNDIVHASKGEQSLDELRRVHYRTCMETAKKTVTVSDVIKYITNTLDSDLCSMKINEWYDAIFDHISGSIIVR